jgi:O-Antigen ligase
VSPPTSTLHRKEIASEVSEGSELTTNGSAAKHQPADVLLGRLAAASVACTPFWLPIVNDWHSWSTGLVVTLGEVPLIGFTLLAAPKTFRSIAEHLVRRPKHTNSARTHQEADEHQPQRDRTARLGIDPYLVGLVLLLVSLTLSAIAHPHLRGLQTLWRVLAMICLAETVVRRRVRAVSIVHALIGVVTLETAMAIWQRITHTPVGLGILGESPVPFYGFGDNGFAVNGTLPHPYPLAALALVSGSAAIVFGGRRLISFRIAALGAATSSIIIGLTISRSGLLSAAGIMFATFLSVLMTWRRNSAKLRTTFRSDSGTLATTPTHAEPSKAHKLEHLLRLAYVGIFALGLAGSMVASTDAWSNRAVVQKQGQSVNEMSSARGDRMSEALGVYQLSPILGVGPGRYVIALASRPELLHSSPEDALPAHNAGLLLLAEGGIPTALALLFIASVLGRRLLKLGADGIILTSAVFPFLMLDIVFVSLPSGLFLLGVWGALISALTLQEQHRPAITR